MDKRASETRARMKITPREKGETRGMSLCLALGDFHARSSFALSTIPEDKWGTTRRCTPFLLFNIFFSSREINKLKTIRHGDPNLSYISLPQKVVLKDLMEDPCILMNLERKRKGISHPL